MVEDAAPDGEASDIEVGARSLRDELAADGFTLENLPLAVAHRAGNHRNLLEEAAAYGADIVEADVYYRRGQLEIRHLKTMGPVPLLWDRWVLEPGWRKRTSLAELVQGVAECGYAGQLMLDLKGNDMRLVDGVARAMDREVPGMRYAVCARLWGLIDPFLVLENVQVYHSVGTQAERARLDAHLAQCGGDWRLSVNGRLLDEGVAAWLASHEAFAVSWHINSREDLKLAMRCGINGVTSDNVTMLREIARLRSLARECEAGPSNQALTEMTG